MNNILKRLFWKLMAPVRWQLEELTEGQNYLSKRQIVLDSPFWDENYYFCHYNNEILESGLYPLDHFMQIGWKLGYNPSEFFDCLSYKKRINSQQNDNPLVHFLYWGRFHSVCGYSSNVFPVSRETIDKYLDFKTRRTSNSVVYTCITNDYDDLSAISSHYYVDPDWDYVCFSDNPQLIAQKQLGIWEVRPLVFDNLDNTRNNRYHKILPHRLFPEYDQSLYLDANINILTPYPKNRYNFAHACAKSDLVSNSFGFIE